MSGDPSAWIHPKVQYPAYLDFSKLNDLIDATQIKKADAAMAKCAAKLNSTEGERLMINECEALVWASVPPPDKFVIDAANGTDAAQRQPVYQFVQCSRQAALWHRLPGRCRARYPVSPGAHSVQRGIADQASPHRRSKRCTPAARACRSSSATIRSARSSSRRPVDRRSSCCRA